MTVLWEDGVKGHMLESHKYEPFRKQTKTSKLKCAGDWKGHPVKSTKDEAKGGDEVCLKLWPHLPCKCTR